jgi:hypothetical protein
MALFEQTLHPRTKAHVAGEVKPPKTVKEHAGEGFNAFLAVKITTAVGTMACAYIFTLIAVISLPTILKQAGFGIGFVSPANREASGAQPYAKGSPLAPVERSLPAARCLRSHARRPVGGFGVSVAFG